MKLKTERKTVYTENLTAKLKADVARGARRKWC